MRKERFLSKLFLQIFDEKVLAIVSIKFGPPLTPKLKLWLPFFLKGNQALNGNKVLVKKIYIIAHVTIYSLIP